MTLPSISISARRIRTLKSQTMFLSPRRSARRARFCLHPARLGLAIAALSAFSVPAAADSLLIRPARIFDGTATHAGWNVLVEGDRIVAAGPNLAAPAGVRTVDLPDATLLPGMIEGHSHLFLHPYNETLWDDQVLHEPLALRTARAVVQAELQPVPRPLSRTVRPDRRRGSGRRLTAVPTASGG